MNAIAEGKVKKGGVGSVPSQPPPPPPKGQGGSDMPMNSDTKVCGEWEMLILKQIGSPKS